MPLIVRTFPVLPGKEEDIRKLAADLAGPRREEARAFYKNFGVARESWHYQKTPHGAVVIGVTEIEDPVAKGQEYAESNRPFDRWFKDQVRNLTGIDPDVQPLGPPSELIFDTQSVPRITVAKFMRVIHILGFVWAGLAVASFLALNLSPAVQKAILIAWLLVPPIYFFFELHWVREHLRAELDNCKMSQEAAAKIWAGVFAALALMYFGCR